MKKHRKVLNIELDQIIETCKFLEDKWCPNHTSARFSISNLTKLSRLASFLMVNGAQSFC
ncbi:hypothetical protein HanRHA438_Chr08g0363341 [Helianthus annuus]|nr:hypothetical protein HanRHA438_Chr08g0363341 [Helianthus annuus]